MIVMVMSEQVMNMVNGEKTMVDNDWSMMVSCPQRVIVVDFVVDNWEYDGQCVITNNQPL